MLHSTPLATAALAVAMIPLLAAGNETGAPKAVFVEPIKDFDIVPKGQMLQHTFEVENEGSSLLELTEVRSSCGCMVATFDRSVAPGQVGKVSIRLDTSDFSGPISKGASVFTNDPDTPRIELTIRAKVEPFISVKPGYARYITVQGEPLEGDIVQSVWAPDGTPFDITSVDSPYPFLHVTFREAKPEERAADVQGKQWRVEMQLSNDATVGALADYVTVHTNHPKQKIVRIPISGFVRPVMAVTPPVADFGQIDLTEPLRKALIVRNFATEPIKVTGVEQNLKGVEAKIEPLKEGREYQVRLILKPELEKGPFNGKLTIHTDSPKVPQLEVTFKGTVL